MSVEASELMFFDYELNKKLLKIAELNAELSGKRAKLDKDMTEIRGLMIQLERVSKE